MTQDIEARRCRHGWRQRPRVLRIEIAERGLEKTTRDPGLYVHPLEVEHRHARRLASGSGRRRDREQRTQWTGHGESLANRWIHVIEEVSGRMGRVEVRDLGCGPRLRTSAASPLASSLHGTIDPTALHQP